MNKNYYGQGSQVFLRRGTGFRDLYTFIEHKTRKEVFAYAKKMMHMSDRFINIHLEQLWHTINCAIERTKMKNNEQLEIYVKTKINPSSKKFCNNEELGKDYRACRFLCTTASYCLLFEHKLRENEEWLTVRLDECVDNTTKK